MQQMCEADFQFLGQMALQKTDGKLDIPLSAMRNKGSDPVTATERGDRLVGQKVIALGWPGLEMEFKIAKLRILFRPLSYFRGIQLWASKLAGGDVEISLLSRHFQESAKAFFIMAKLWLAAESVAQWRMDSRCRKDEVSSAVVLQRNQKYCASQRQTKPSFL